MTLVFKEGTDAAYFISQLDEESKLQSPPTQTPTQIKSLCMTVPTVQAKLQTKDSGLKCLQ